MIGLKLGRPRWFDATALCIGSMAPDLLYTVSSYLRIDTHRAPAAFTWGLPVAVVLSTIVRFVLAPVAPAQLPDMGRFRLHSFAVLAHRRPAIAATVFSAFLGIGSHIVVDWFTHPGRPGGECLGYENVTVTVFGVTEPLAGVLQVLGHSLGSLAGVWLLWVIGERRLLEQWYGADVVEHARRWSPTTVQRTLFWTCVAIGLVVGGVWGADGEFIEQIHRPFAGATFGAIVASAVMRRDAVGASRQHAVIDLAATPVGVGADARR